MDLIINLIFSLMTCILSLFIYVICLIFGIFVLVTTPNNNSIWFYLLVSIILLFLSMTLVLFSKKDDNILTKIIIIALCHTCNIIWGGYELFNNNFHQTILYKLSLVYWILSLIIVSTTIIFLIYDLCKSHVYTADYSSLIPLSLRKLGESDTNVVMNGKVENLSIHATQLCFSDIPNHDINNLSEV